MKCKYIFAAAIIVLTISVVGCSGTRRIEVDPPLDSLAVRSLIDSQHFVFVARYVNPMTGRRRDLDPGYELLISKDSLISYLPFFGRGYIAPISPADVDYDFKSTNFIYSVTPDRRGWNISIKPKDQTYLRELYLRIYDNGSGSLTITSIDRSMISYDGHIKRRRSYR